MSGLVGNSRRHVLLCCGSFTVKKTKTIWTPEKFLDHVVLRYNNVSERYRLNGKQRTINFLNIRTPKKFVVITLKFELPVCGFTIE